MLNEFQVVDACAGVMCDIRPMVAFQSKSSESLAALDRMTNYSFPYTITLPCSLKNSVSFK
jgi:hypothetical protein